MYRKALLIAVVVLLAASFATAAFAQARLGGPWRQFTSARLQARLNLTPDQMQQIRQIIQAQRANAPRPAAPAVNAAQEHRALMKAIFGDAPNQAEIEKHVAALSQQAAAQCQLRGQRLSQSVSAMLEISKVLTPEQRAEFQKMLDENVRTQQIMHRRMMMNPRRGGLVPPQNVPN